MEEVIRLFNTINELEGEFKMLYLCGGISKEVYEELLGKLHFLDNNLRKFRFEPAPEGLSFSETEKFINDHINLADTSVLYTELGRRNADFKETDSNDKK